MDINNRAESFHKSRRIFICSRTHGIKVAPKGDKRSHEEFAADEGIMDWAQVPRGFLSKKGLYFYQGRHYGEVPSELIANLVGPVMTALLDVPIYTGMRMEQEGKEWKPISEIELKNGVPYSKDL